MLKSSIYYVFSLIGVFTLFSCGTTGLQEVASNSPNKSNMVKISGTRSTGLDPFQTSIIVKGYDRSDTLMTEIYAQKLTSENVLFAWSDDSKCIVTIVQQDDTKRVMDIVFSPDGNSLHEIK